MGLASGEEIRGEYKYDTFEFELADGAGFERITLTANEGLYTSHVLLATDTKGGRYFQVTHRNNELKGTRAMRFTKNSDGSHVISTRTYSLQGGAIEKSSGAEFTPVELFGGEGFADLGQELLGRGRELADTVYTLRAGQSIPMKVGAPERELLGVEIHGIMGTSPAVDAVA